MRQLANDSWNLLPRQNARAFRIVDGFQPGPARVRLHKSRARTRPDRANVTQDGLRLPSWLIGLQQMLGLTFPKFADFVFILALRVQVRIFHRQTFGSSGGVESVVGGNKNQRRRADGNSGLVSGNSRRQLDGIVTAQGVFVG